MPVYEKRKDQDDLTDMPPPSVAEDAGGAGQPGSLAGSGATAAAAAPVVSHWAEDGKTGQEAAIEAASPDKQPEAAQTETVSAKEEPLKDPNQTIDPAKEETAKPAEAEQQGTEAAKEAQDDKAATGDKDAEAAKDGGAAKEEEAKKEDSPESVSDRIYVSRLAAQARTNPEAVRDLIKDNGDGTYTVTLHLKEAGTDKRVPRDIIVDSGFSNESGEVAFAKPGEETDNWPEMWAMLIQKAYTQVSQPEEAGNQAEKDDDIFGVVMDVETKSLKLGQEDRGNVIDQIVKAVLNGQAVTLKPKSADSDELKGEMASEGVFSNHSYVVMRIDVDAGTINLHNPWASKVLEDFPIDKMLKLYDSCEIAPK